MTSPYILWFSIPEGSEPRKAPIVKPARLANGKSGPSGRLTVVHGRQAIRDTLARERRNAQKAGRRLYRVDLMLEVAGAGTKSKPSVENLKDFSRLDLALMTGDLRRAFMERAFGAGSGDPGRDGLLSAIAAKPEAINEVWGTNMFKHVRVFTFPTNSYDLASRRAIIRSSHVIDGIEVQGWSEEWPLPVVEWD